MKRNAIARIILYSILALVLIAILCGSLLEDDFIYFISFGNGTTVDGEASVEATKIKNLEIDWAAGSIEIRAAQIDHITIREVIPENCDYKMTYQVIGDTLKLNYDDSNMAIGFGNFNIPSKDLVVTVPMDWVCETLEIDGAALKIDLDELIIGTLELDGASCTLNFSGSADTVEIDGASSRIFLECINRISNIQVNGASCKLDVILPEDCGFQLDMDGLNCNLYTDLPGVNANGQTFYGDGHCHIEIDGISCDITIQQMPLNFMD